MRIFLATERPALRYVTAADAGDLFELNGDPAVTRFLTGGQPTARDEVRHRIIPFFLSFYERDGGTGYWAVQDKDTGDFLGWFHFRPAEHGAVEYALTRAD
jgi:RimJ/RimL family protein N-acetyltransferase